MQHALPRFYAEDGFIWLEFQHWTLVCNIGLNEMQVRLDDSCWQTARQGADIKPLQRAMCDAINTIVGVRCWSR